MRRFTGGTFSGLSAAAALALGALSAAGAEPAAYDPLAVAPGTKIAPVSFTVHDSTRNRDIPIRVYLPEAKTAAPVVLFSHGLGGSGLECAYMGEHWAARGYAAVFVQHPGSDTSVWQGKAPGEVMASLYQAANLQNFLLRVQDVPAVLDQLTVWNKETGHALYGRLDMEHIGMSGHSFGAVTTEALSGEVASGGLVSLTEPRIRAAVAFSPSTPVAGDPKAVFANVRIPWMLMTGTKDIAPIGHQTVASRLAVYDSLPPGNKYEVVLNGGEHSAFTDRPLPGDHESRNPNHHRVILALSTAFWDAYLKQDAAARAWLDGEGPRLVLEPADRWEKK